MKGEQVIITPVLKIVHSRKPLLRSSEFPSLVLIYRAIVEKVEGLSS